MKRRPLSLQIWLTLLVCTVVVASLSASGYLIGINTAENVQQRQAEKVMNIASIVSRTQVVIDGLTGKVPHESVQDFTRAVQLDTGVHYIVVMNNDRIRLSHPMTSRIGQYFVGNDEDRAFLGEEYTSIATGTLGESMRAFVPIWDGNRQIGVVAVGILLENIQHVVKQNQKSVYIGILIGLLIGIIGAFFLARKVKRTLFGLEPGEIAQLLHEREAMLASLREGMIAINENQEIIVANNAALRLFRKAHLGKHPVGQSLGEYLSSASLTNLLVDDRTIYDEEQTINGVNIVINKVPVKANQKRIGTVATFRERSELTSLAEQLSGVKAYAETLRMQTHEFMNKLHVITAMVHTKAYDELSDYLAYLSHSYQKEVGSISRLVKDPVIAGYLLNKLGEARELGIEVEINGSHGLPTLKTIEHMDKIITVLGNLCDNAFEAVANQTNKHVQFMLHYEDNRFYFKVKDNGPGIAANERHLLFEKGVSTKGANRGFGLYLTKKAVTDLNGNIDIRTNEDGTEFHVELPYEGENK